MSVIQIENQENMKNLIGLLRDELEDVKPDFYSLVNERELAAEIEWMETHVPTTKKEYMDLIISLVNFLGDWLPDDEEDVARIKELLSAAENYLS